MTLINGIEDFIKSNNKNTAYTCTQYANNPYVSAVAPVSQIVVPQGNINMPSNIVQPPEVQAVQYPPKYAPGVNYNQITPYINSNSPVFQPKITTKSGQPISMAPPESSKPVTQSSSQLVYEGPVKEFNPQVTPVEQYDNEIVKEMQKYYQNRFKYNDELREALKKSMSERDSFAKKTMKTIGVIAAVALAYKFRAKIPFIKRFCK